MKTTLVFSNEKQTVLDISNMRLTHLPYNLPASLKRLYCINNRLTHLPNTLPAFLKVLDCKNNPLSKHPNSMATTQNVFPTPSLFEICSMLINNSPVEDINEKLLMKGECHDCKRNAFLSRKIRMMSHTSYDGELPIEYRLCGYCIRK